MYSYFTHIATASTTMMESQIVSRIIIPCLIPNIRVLLVHSNYEKSSSINEFSTRFYDNSKVASLRFWGHPVYKARGYRALMPLIISVYNYRVNCRQNADGRERCSCRRREVIKLHRPSTRCSLFDLSVSRPPISVPKRHHHSLVSSVHVGPSSAFVVHKLNAHCPALFLIPSLAKSYTGVLRYAGIHTVTLYYQAL